MTKSAFLKDPVLSNKMKVNISNPAGDLIQEINEQSLSAAGINTIMLTTPLTIVVTPQLTIGLPKTTLGAICFIN
ncbi:MAG TPA: plantaricin C family lantibiotic [Ruminiclostridium sp.]|nr:plantaricin C family lantibiotic [Ruminiclostridium sp.]